MQPNMILNMLKGLWLGQSALIPEGFTPFKTLAALITQSLAQFNNSSSIIIINGLEFSFLSNELSSSNRKNGRLYFIIPADAD